MTLPSAKVTTQFLVGLALTIAAYLAADADLLDNLPGWVAPLAAPVLAAVVAYMKAETNPAPSSGQR